VLSSTLGALTDRIDAKFLTAYWLPAFVGVFGGFLMLGVLVGARQMDAWVNDLDSVEKSIGALVVLLQITMLAFVLRAMTRPIAEVFAGSALPRTVADWSKKGQRRARNATAQMLGVDSVLPDTSMAAPPAMYRLNQMFPRDEANVQPTLLGNIFATAAEYPWRTYAMDGAFWWPRLSPLLPASYQDMLGGTQSPMMALLNLSAVFATLAILGFAVLGLAGTQWLPAIAFLVGGAVLSRLCYRATVSQAVELGKMLRVAFDLYRYEILKQIGLDAPSDLTAERALWLRLTYQLLDLPEPPTAADQ
jgi:hypothetical protein